MLTCACGSASMTHNRVVRELAVRPHGGEWGTLGRNLRTDFHVTSGVRRVSHQQLNPLRNLGVEITQEVMDREKWYVFWDAPLLVPGLREGDTTGMNPGLPRSPDEIREASATFETTACRIRTDGLRLEVTFDGLSMGIFSGELRFTVYEGTNLVRLEAIAATQEPSVAYKYRGGLRGFSTAHTSRVTWRDVQPKYLIADCDTYHKFPGDDIYPNVPVNYLRLDRVPLPDEDWTPILDALRAGDFFVTTGQILITDYAVAGSGDARTITADLEWTFPLEFVEVVWGDGERVGREIVRATDSTPFGSRRFEIPFDAAGKSWVRFAAWDSAGNGAFVQPVWLTAQ